MRAMRHALALAVLFLGVACSEECPADESIFIGGEEYCGSPCATCDACGDGFSCQFTGSRGVCVDEPFLVARSRSTACEDPCPLGETRFDDMGNSVCVRICAVDGECPFCCYEPPEIEITICAPRAELCP